MGLYDAVKDETFGEQTVEVLCRAIVTDTTALIVYIVDTMSGLEVKLRTAMQTQLRIFQGTEHQKESDLPNWLLVKVQVAINTK